jgi:hypothetical protein
VTDTILTSRVNALETNLARLRESISLIDTIPLEEGASEFKDKLGRVVDTGVTRCVKRLGTVRGLLEPGNGNVPADVLENAWSDFLDIQEESRELFSSCLEFIGGVAFREMRGSQDDVFRIADALNFALARQVLGESYYYLTVPALEEALRESQVRTIRLRFPEWTLWNLPLVAFEFGHVAIRGMDESYLRDLLKQQADKLFDDDTDLQASLESADELYVAPLTRSARRSCTKHIRVLMADAIATYTMGPAYACAAIQLHFGPNEVLPTRKPSWSERTRVVLGCLEAMNDEWGGDDLVALMRRLEEDWSATSSRAAILPVEAQRLAYLEEHILPALTENMGFLHTAAKYNQEAWLRAQMFSSQWTTQLKAKTIDPKLDEDSPRELRDILNAAWRCRMAGQWMDEIEAAATRDCLRHLESRERRTGGAGQAARKYGGPFKGSAGSA